MPSQPSRGRANKLFSPTAKGKVTAATRMQNTDSANSPAILPTRLRIGALLSIGVAFACNVAVLFLPFITLRKGIGHEPYSLFHSIAMMWEDGLYVLATLVVGFSVLFPFAKLATLGWVASSASVSTRQLRWLTWAERLGKWSMLDVFLVSIILMLASRQFFVGAKAQPGLALFIAAILLSMATGESLARGLRSHPRPISPATPVPRKPRGLLLLVLSGATLAAALALPFLRIEDWLLANREYSILALVPALWGQGAWLAATLTVAFLIATPVLTWIASCWTWRRQRRGESDAATPWVAIAQRWSMLDVFGLALIVFAIESDRLMQTEIHWGALFLGATLALQAGLNVALDRTVEARA